MTHCVAPLLLGLMIAAYWGRVLRMAYKAKKRGSNAANLIPPEPLGKLLRLAWAPAIILWIVAPMMVAIGAAGAFAWKPFYQSASLMWAAVAIVAMAFLATVACWKKMGRAWRMGIDPAEQTQLIATGAFAYVRHPIYALSQLMMLATVAAVPSPLMLAAGLIHIVLLQWESRREELHLSRVQGQRYADYCRQVGRFLPRRLSPYIGVESVKEQ